MKKAGETDLATTFQTLEHLDESCEGKLEFFWWVFQLKGRMLFSSGRPQRVSSLNNLVNPSLAKSPMSLSYNKYTSLHLYALFF